MGSPVWTILVLVLTQPFLTVAEQVSLGCQEGWRSVGLHCYRLFPQQMAWDVALDVCYRYGSHLLRIKDLDGQEAALGTLAAEHGVTHLWLADTSAPHANNADDNYHHHSNHHHHNLHHPHQHHYHHHHPTPAMPLSLHHYHHITTPSAQVPRLWPHAPGEVEEEGDVEEEEEGEEEEGLWEGRNVTYSGPGGPGQCVLARVVGGDEGRRLVWGFAPCLRLTSPLCRRPAAPDGSFHCHTGGFVERRFVCDGDDDCGDASDETNCTEQCRHHVQSSSQTEIRMTVGRPPSADDPAPPAGCLWLLEAPVGYTARLEFSDFATTPSQGDEVVVLMGGMTAATSRQVARLSGQGDVTRVVSVNNLLMVLLTPSAHNSTLTTFSAIFTAMKAEGFEPQQKVTATAEAQDLMSPFYPGYLSGQDYVWVITALDTHHLLTLQIIDVDLNGEDTVEIRDGNSVYAPLLHVLGSRHARDGDDEHVTHVQSTGRHLFVAMRTRGLETGEGFYFRYWEGCSIQLVGQSGSVVSPGYLAKGAHYPANQTCVYDVTVPEQQTATLIFDAVDIHTSDDLTMESDGQWVHTVRGTDAPGPVDFSSGTFRLTFRSDDKLTARGFALRYSVGCPKLPSSSVTAVQTESHVHHFGSTVTLTCGPGHAFPPLSEPPSEGEAAARRSLVLECLFGGVWNASVAPVCKALCQPGTFFERTMESCRACPKDHYQGDVNATSCRPCPAGTVTEDKGANSSSECKEACPAGHKYCLSLQGCEPCPQGTYQDLPAQFSCRPCPLFKTTPRTGANSSDLCSVEVMDKDTEEDLSSQELMVVSFKDNHHHHHHHPPDPVRAPNNIGNPLSNVLLLLPPNSSPALSRKGRLDPRWRSARRGSLLSPGMYLQQLSVSRPSEAHEPPGEAVDSAEKGYGEEGRGGRGGGSERESPSRTNPEEDGAGSEQAPGPEDVVVSQGDDLVNPEDVLVVTDWERSRWWKEADAGWGRKQQGGESVGGGGGGGRGDGGGGRGRGGGLGEVLHMGPFGLERVKRAAVQSAAAEEEEKESGCGSGADPCELLVGQPCNYTQNCVAEVDTYTCVCKPHLYEVHPGLCVETPDSHKLYLTTPFALPFDPDLADQTSMAFITFRLECEQAFEDVFRVVEGWKAVQVIEFRSVADGRQLTYAVYALFFTVPVTEEMKVRTARAVLHMERYGDLQVGVRELPLSGHTGIFSALVNIFNATDDVNWCGVASLHQCADDKVCVPEGFRYKCQCQGSTFESGGSCVHVGALAGGVVGGIVVIVSIIVIVVIVIRRRRRRKTPNAYSSPEESKGLTSQHHYSNVPSSSQHGAQPDGSNEDLELHAVYSEIAEHGQENPTALGDARERPRATLSSHEPAEAEQTEPGPPEEPNLYSPVGELTATHQYEDFRFHGRGGAEGGSSQRTLYANMGAPSPPQPSQPQPPPELPLPPLDNRNSGVYMNVRGSERSGHGGDKVYSNIDP
ncbi:uncharacterized protein LOC143292575 isoform X2 [Babylonia areolata]|uniref:uncharacterized protein LOC143292575 isoform X1 n=1 Tax=Babylonia areolata TaxID=304850 RepID=UPI003FD184BD